MENTQSLTNFGCLRFCYVLSCIFLLSFSEGFASEFEFKLRKATAEFLSSLDDAQQQECLQEMDAAVRWKKRYTGGKLAGIKIKSLSAEQKKFMERLFRLVLSDYGWKMAEAVAKQDGENGLGKYHVACFGDPRKVESPFAIRLSEHHLTVVNFEVVGDVVAEFGPILLGANPPNLWLEDESFLMKAWKELEEQGKTESVFQKQAGIASRLMEPNHGALFSSLPQNVQAIFKQAWVNRLRMFTPEIQDRINALQRARGGWEKSRIAFYKNPAVKATNDGGRWDFKCGLPGMVWDFEGSRSHIHMSLCIHPLDKKNDK